MPNPTPLARSPGVLSVILRFAATALALCVGGLAHPTSAQNRVAASPLQIDGRPQCATCALRVVQVAHIGGENGPGALERRPRAVLRDSRGQYYVLAGRLPQVFDSTGRYLRTLATVGAGPAELRAPMAATIIRNDSIAVFDGELSRVSVFDRQGNHGWSRTITPRVLPFSAFGLPDNSFAITAIFSSGDSPNAIHIVAPDGKLARSFGAGTNPDASDRERSIAFGAGGSIWATRRFRHTLERYDTTGRLLAEYSIATDWFSAVNPDWEPNPSVRPPTNTRHILADSSTGTIWLFVEVPRKDWSASVRPLGGGRSGYLNDPFRAFETRVEVLDPRSRTTLVSETIPHFLIAVMPGGFVAAYEESDDGVPQLRILRLALRR
jgi:hypothetical protein